MEKKNDILNIDDINTYYGESHIIQGLTLHVKEREAVSILGRNGVGKTTTLRSVMGLTSPRSGAIHIDGEETTNWPAHKISKLGVAYVPAERHIFPGLRQRRPVKTRSRMSSVMRVLRSTSPAARRAASGRYGSLRMTSGNWRGSRRKSSSLRTRSQICWPRSGSQ